MLEGDNIKEDLERGSKIRTDFKRLTLIASEKMVRKQ